MFNGVNVKSLIFIVIFTDLFFLMCFLMSFFPQAKHFNENRKTLRQQNIT